MMVPQVIRLSIAETRQLLAVQLRSDAASRADINTREAMMASTDVQLPVQKIMRDVSLEAMMADLPPWDPSMSDGCSVPEFLRPFFPCDDPAVRAVCVIHDADYYYGGTREQRLASDVMFCYNLIATGKVSAETAEKMLAGVRVGGGPSGRIPGVSWAFGGERFCYDPSPSGWEVGGYR